MAKALVTLTFVLFHSLLFAQSEVEMADTLRSEGKIYVVVAIMLIIFLGLIGYLFFGIGFVFQYRLLYNTSRKQELLAFWLLLLASGLPW